MKKIVIDIYGADAGIEPVVLGVAKALKMGVGFFPVLVGEEKEIDALMQKEDIGKEAYEVINTDKFISNNEPPTVIFGGRDDSSLALSYGKLKNDDEAIALLSPGNTGAILVGSICRLGLLKGLKFPALASALPCNGEGKPLVCLVDCGANIDPTADDLARFSKMGSVFAESYIGVENARVGLMSVGREKEKGNNLTKEAYAKIKELPINFIGNLEGSDLVSGYADVIVCDGFSGNLLLKCTEAAGKKALSVIEELGLCLGEENLSKIRNAIFKTFDFNSQGAATFLGPKKIVVKMHGCANVDTTVASIEQILRLDGANFCENMKKTMEI